jgi:hypothetical protein
MISHLHRCNFQFFSSCEEAFRGTTKRAGTFSRLSFPEVSTGFTLPDQRKNLQFQRASLKKSPLHARSVTGSEDFRNHLPKSSHSKMYLHRRRPLSLHRKFFEKLQKMGNERVFMHKKSFLCQLHKTFREGHSVTGAYQRGRKGVDGGTSLRDRTISGTHVRIQPNLCENTPGIPGVPKTHSLSRRNAYPPGFFGGKEDGKDSFFRKIPVLPVNILPHMICDKTKLEEASGFLKTS